MSLSQDMSHENVALSIHAHHRVFLAQLPLLDDLHENSPAKIDGHNITHCSATSASQWLSVGMQARNSSMLINALLFR